MKKTITTSLIYGMMILGLLICGMMIQSSIWAKSFSGSYTINLPKGQKLVNTTWKDSDLWYITKPMIGTDEAETYTFQKDSTFSIVKGTITIVECK